MRWLGLVLLGCAGDDPSGETGRERVELVDRGRACVFGGPPSDEVETTFTVGDPVSARVVLEGCASGCAADVSATCELRVVQTELVVTASGSYTLPLGSPGCDDLCVPIVAECTGEGLAAAVWTLDYAGGHSETFEVPGTGPAPCAEPLF